MSDPREPAEEPVASGEDELELEPGDEPELEPGDEPEPEPEPGDEPEPEPGEEPAPRRSRGSEAVRAQRARAQQAERELAETRQRLADIERQVQQFRQQPVDPAAAARAAAERAERRRLMSPDELAADITQELSGQFGTAFQQLQFQHNDALDQQRFEASALRSPVRARYADRVEETLRAERAAGRNHSREALFKYLYGDDMEKRATRAAAPQRRAAAARVAGQVVRPGSTRSDSVQGRRVAPGTAAHDDAILDEARRSGRSPWE